MTTDPFTEAARAEAEDYARTPRMNVGTVRDRIAEAHRAGAEWARTHLAAQEPTDAEVEAAAIECVKFLFLTAPERPWEDPEAVEQWEPMARIALRSARAARRDEETAMSTDEYVPSDDQVRGRYSDGAIWQGVETETSDQHLEDFDAWLARVRRDAKAEASLMDGFDMAVADRLADAGYTEYAEDEDGGVTWVSAPLGEVLHIVRICATECETGDRA